MIDERKFEKALDKMEELASYIGCMTCGSTITREEFDQLEAALKEIRLSYIGNCEL